MDDVNRPGPDPEDPYAYTGEAGDGASGGPPEQRWEERQPPTDVKQRRKGMWRAAGVGIALTIAFVAGMCAPLIWYDLTLADTLSGAGALGFVLLLVASIVLLFPGKTRVWGSGLLIGIGIGLATAFIVLAGVCVVALASYDGTY